MPGTMPYLALKRGLNFKTEQRCVFPFNLGLHSHLPATHLYLMVFQHFMPTSKTLLFNEALQGLTTKKRKQGRAKTVVQSWGVTL